MKIKIEELVNKIQGTDWSEFETSRGITFSVDYDGAEPIVRLMDFKKGRKSSRNMELSKNDIEKILSKMS